MAPINTHRVVDLANGAKCDPLLVHAKRQLPFVCSAAAAMGGVGHGPSSRRAGVHARPCVLAVDEADSLYANPARMRRSALPVSTMALTWAGGDPTRSGHATSVPTRSSATEKDGSGAAHAHAPSAASRAMRGPMPRREECGLLLRVENRHFSTAETRLP